MLEFVQMAIVPILGILIPILGWMTKGIFQLNKTLSSFDKSLGIVENVQQSQETDIKLLFTKTDSLEKELAEVRGRCSVIHQSLGI